MKPPDDRGENNGVKVSKDLMEVVYDCGEIKIETASPPMTRRLRYLARANLIYNIHRERATTMLLLEDEKNALTLVPSVGKLESKEGMRICPTPRLEKGLKISRKGIAPLISERSVRMASRRE